MLEKEVCKKKHIVLVVDDDEAMRFLMTESISQAGVCVEEAENGIEALKIFERTRPDLVLMDVNMPKMDGFTACTRLRQMPGGKNATIIMVTGLDDVKSIQMAYHVGATDFITKPISWPVLKQRVIYLLRAGDTVKALRKSEKRLTHAKQVAKLGNWDWDIVTGDIFWSDEIYTMLELKPGQFRPELDVFIDAVHPGERLNTKKAFLKALYDNNKGFNIDHKVVLADGTERTLSQQIITIRDESGKPVHMHGIMQDITEHKKAEEKIRTLAYYDPLTSLPNRELFKEHTNHAIRTAKRNGTYLALIYLDLDQFKRINDTLGHSAGDELLKKVAKTLYKSIRSSDIVGIAHNKEPDGASISRLGGDEFSILITGLTDVQNSAKVADRVIKNLSRPILIEGHEFTVSCSMGIALYPMDGKDVETLLKNADAAMYNAKERGRNNYQFYTTEMNSHILAKVSMEAKLKNALKKNEFLVYYQPQVEAATGRFIGLEALIRWQHPEMGLVQPNDFIPLSEETGLIIPIGEFVLKTACEQARTFIDSGLPRLRMAVNISGKQFKEKNLVDTLLRILCETDLDPQYLEVELTESSLINDVDKTINMLKKIKETGVKVAIDDFGTGYSSMNYLKQFPLDTLKIDYTFVKDIETNPDDVAITKAIISMAKSLGLSTIAEGVETEKQYEILCDMGCDEIQGFLISRPVPAEDIVFVLNRLALERCEPTASRTRTGHGTNGKAVSTAATAF
ncbi:MAG: EAL domain-containing protein [Desulfosarcina sp.]|nr:EAL domain-containing protein [Desulfobacterales bacterium]